MPTASGRSLPMGFPAGSVASLVAGVLAASVASLVVDVPVTSVASLVGNVPAASVSSLLEDVLIGVSGGGSKLIADLESSASCSQLREKDLNMLVSDTS